MFIDLLERNLQKNILWNEVNKLQDEKRTFGINNFPLVNYYLEGDNAHIFVMLPGLNPDDIHISVEGRKMEISGEIKQEYTAYQFH